jgi:transmembrane sensor
MKREEKIVGLIVKLFSGKISPEENKEINDWIKESPGNKKVYSELLNLWQVTHPAFPPEKIDVEAAHKKFMEQVKEKKLIPSEIIIWWQRIAAILIIPVLGLSGYLLYDKSFRYNSTDTVYQEITSPYGMSSKVDLPDGTTVWLNSGSKLKYPVAFASNERKVYLSGEAYFDVQSDKNHPFLVETDKMLVKATGTQFNVEAYLTDTITAVTLIEGIVSINPGKPNENKLLPNERIILNSKTNTYRKIKTDANHWGDWKDGILAFRDEPLGDVFKKIGRSFNVNIQVKDPAISRQLYRATFDGESLDEILRLLKLSAPIQYKYTERTIQSDNKFNKKQIEVYGYK